MFLNLIIKKFFDEYYHALPISGIKCLRVSSEDLIKENDKLLEFIGILYDISTNVPMDKNLRDSTLDKVEKLLGII